MKRESLYFLGSNEAEVREENIDEPRKNEVLVESIVSSVSAGTEMHFYHGELEEGIMIDGSIEKFKKGLEYPLKYGYSNMGRVITVGEDVSDEWLGEIVLSFHPHETHHIHQVDELIKKPDGIGVERFSFLPCIETAVNFMMDGKGMIGERVLVSGQGVIGLLTTRLLKMLPLEKLVTLDNLENRRKWSKKLGADVSLSGKLEFEDILKKSRVEDFDLVFEVSGNIKGLEKAVDLAGFGGRIIVGSWYSGKKGVKLGTYFHRNRIKMISSQVSSISGRFLDRWDKDRRLKTSLKMLDEVEPEKLISHKINFKDAPKAYETIDGDEENLQILLEY